MKRVYQSGFVLLYAVLVASVVAIGGALLADIILKQLILSSVGRESQFAYYAANAGDECARYYDGRSNNRRAFGRIRTTPQGNIEYVAPIPSLNNINCNGLSLPVDPIVGPNSNGGTFVFVLPRLDRGACAIVTVTKDKNEPDGKRTTLEVKGYNQGDDDCKSLSPRRIEKAIYRVY